MRLQLTKKTDQALQALLLLAERPERTKASTLAAVIGTTPGILPQVLHPLVGAGWLSSTTGPTGGYQLEVPLHEISLLALIEAVEGPTDTGRCVLADRKCGGDDPCALHEPWQRARRSLTDELDRAPLSSLTCTPPIRASRSGRKEHR